MKPKNLHQSANNLYLGKYALTDLAKEYQTPLYVYDEDHLNTMMKLYKKHFKSAKFATEIVYASKAFLVPDLCQMLVNHGLMMDAVSLGDLFVAKEAGFPLEQIVFHGNNKSYEELVFAIDYRVGIIVVDNLEELKLLQQLASEKRSIINTLFRVNPGIDTHTHKYIQTAQYVSKFGESIYDQKKIDDIINAYRGDEFVKLRGFHSHIGSQIKEVEPFILEIEKMINFCQAQIVRHQITLPYLNLGGGFGITYMKDSHMIDINILLKQLIKKIETKCREVGYYPEVVMIEPGRSIVGNAGITLYECSMVKETFGGKNYLFINGGMTDNIRPALYQAEYTVEIANRINDEKQQLVDVVGKCCESGDIIAHNVMIPSIQSGDIVVVYATGAYTYTMSSNYNNMLKPAVIMVGDKVKIISKREELKDLYRLF